MNFTTSNYFIINFFINEFNKLFLYGSIIYDLISKQNM